MIRLLITGHSRGFGAALTREALARGAEVWGVARSPLAGAEAAGPRFRESAVDLARPEALLSWLEAAPLGAWLRGAGTAVLVNNAGVLGPVGRAEDLDLAGIVRTVEVDLVAALVLTAAFARLTTDVPDRRVVHVSSGAGRHAVGGWCVYGACKAALDHHARTLAATAPTGFRVASLAPGVLDTAMQAEIRALPAERFPERQRFLELAHEGRLVPPERAAVRFLDRVLAEDFGRDAVDDLRPATAP